MANFFNSRKRVSFVLTIFLLSGASLVTLSLLRINHVECSLQAGSCPAELLTSTQALKGKWLFTSQEKINQILQSSAPYYRVLKVDRQLPHTLKLTTEKQVASYQLRVAQQPDIKVIADNAQVMNDVPHSEIPTFILSPDIWNDFWATGSPNSEYHQLFKHAHSIFITYQLKPENLLLLDHQTLVLYLPDQTVAIASLQELEVSLQRLELVKRNLHTTPQPEVQEIDVRFQFPVLRSTLTVPRHEAL